MSAKLPNLGWMVVASLCWMLAGCAERSAVDEDVSDAYFDLVELLPIAEKTGLPRRLILGTPEARKYLRSGWSVDEQEPDGSRPYVWAIGAAAELEFFVGHEVDFTLVLEGSTLRAPEEKSQVVDVEINDRRLTTFELGRTVTSHQVAVAAELLRVGDNLLRLRFAHQWRPKDLNPTLADERLLAACWYSIGFEGLGSDRPVRAEVDAEGSKLTIPAGHTVTYYLEPQPQGELQIANLESSSDPLGLFVELETRSGTLARAELAAGSQEPLRLSLPANTEGPRRLVFRTAEHRRETSSGFWRRLSRWFGNGAESDGEVQLIRPEVRWLEAPEEALPEESPVSRSPRPNLLIYVIDTLRADHLGAYGYPRPTSPNIDRFAAQAVLFADAQAQTSWTRTAVASLFTGLNPQSHRVNDRLDAMPDALETLAEKLQQAGYQTAGFITNGNLEMKFNMHQGFTEYHRMPESKYRFEFHRLSDELNARAMPWLEQQRDAENPFFLYLHATDPHAPYTPREPFRQRFAAGIDPAVGGIENVRAVFSGEIEASPDLRAALLALYDGEIAFNDQSFGQLLDRLRELEMYDSTMILLISDHGEEFLDHGGWEHGRTLYREQLHVPMILKLPDGEGAGVTVDALVRQVDVMPTVLDYLGLEIPRGLDGQSVLPLIRGSERPAAVAERTAFAMLKLDQRQLEAAIRDGWKLIQNRTGEDRPWLELYQIDTDPAEEHEVGRQHEFELGYLRHLLRTVDFVAGRRDGVVTPDQVELTQELEEQLRALGYLN